MYLLTNQNKQTNKNKQENTKKNLNFSKSEGFDRQVDHSSAFRWHFHSEISETSFFFDILSVYKLNRNSTETLKLGSAVLAWKHDIFPLVLPAVGILFQAQTVKNSSYPS